MSKKLIQHTITLEVEEKDERLVKSIADKYIFTGDGIQQIDGYMNNFNLVITPKIKQMVRPKNR